MQPEKRQREQNCNTAMMHKKQAHHLTGLEEKNCYLTKVEVDEVLGLMRYVRSEVAANDAVPCGVELPVELLFDVGCDILLNVKLLKSLCRAVNSLLLHFLGHIRIFDHGLAKVRHFGSGSPSRSEEAIWRFSRQEFQIQQSPVYSAGC